MTPAWIKTGSRRVNCVALKDITQRPQQGINVLLTDNNNNNNTIHLYSAINTNYS